MSSGLDENQLDFCSEPKKELHDIKVYWSRTFDDNFNEEDMWRGQFILYEDGWIEGIANGQKSPYIGDRLIFGAYFKDKAIELVKVAPSSASNCFVFRGKKDSKNYGGKIAVIGRYDERPLGNCSILTRRSENQDTRELEARIEAFKQSMIEDKHRYLYKNILKARKDMIEIVRRQHEKSGFNREEIIRMREVSDSVDEAMTDRAVQLVKKMGEKESNFDDELPF